MRRRLGVVVRVVAATALALLFSYLTALLILVFQIRRASQLLEEVQSLSVGDSENSVGPILERFHGHRWDVQLGSVEDYNYALEINPWGFPTLSSNEPRGRVQAVDRVLSPRFRRAIGFRRWMVSSEIAIKQHRVVAVQTSTIVEGAHIWLGAMWRLSEKPAEFEQDTATLNSSTTNSQYPATPGILNMQGGSGTSWSIWTTPASPKGQREMANQVNFGCLRSSSGCNSLCELLPEAARFFKEHPNLAPKGGGWDDGSRTCIKHDLREDWSW
jgi:hypothetical protein